MTPRLDMAGRDWKFIENFNKTGHGIDRNSYVLDANEKIIGKFLGTFPFDSPGTLEVTFTDWHGGFPFRIEFDAPATDIDGPKHFAPLYWNPRIGKFQDKRP